MYDFIRNHLTCKYLFDSIIIILETNEGPLKEKKENINLRVEGLKKKKTQNEGRNLF